MKTTSVTRLAETLQVLCLISLCPCIRAWAAASLCWKPAEPNRHGILNIRDGNVHEYCVGHVNGQARRCRKHNRARAPLSQTTASKTRHGQLGTACELVLEARLSDPKEHSPNRLGVSHIREGNVHEYRRRTRQRSCALLWQTMRGTSAAAAATIIYETKWTNQMHIS